MSAVPVGRHPSWLPWVVLMSATLLLLGSAVYVGSSLGQSLLGPGMAEALPSVVFPSSYQDPALSPTRTARAVATATNGGAMARTRLWLAGNGVRVTTIPAARDRATAASTADGLHPGQVIQFTSAFYVQLKDATGHPAAEVLVDPASGAVFTEYGPAAMWTWGATPALLPLDRATSAATAWLQANAPGLSADTPVLFPGHYTMAALSGGSTAGMLSVNATTGAVWYHTWLGTFSAKQDA